MDKVIDKANELSKEILNTPEVKEYLKLKELIENDEELAEFRINIASLANEGKLEERDNLLKIYNSHPLVANYETAKESVKSLLETIKQIIE